MLRCQGEEMAEVGVEEERQGAEEEGGDEDGWKL